MLQYNYMSWKELCYNLPHNPIPVPVNTVKNSFLNIGDRAFKNSIGLFECFYIFKIERSY